MVPAEAAGERLDVFLADAVGTRTKAQKLIDAGLVRVDGRPRPKRHLLAGGETRRGRAAPGPAAERRAGAFRIAYEDEHLFVVDKPPGVVVHPGPGTPQGTLVQALAGRVAGGPDPSRPGVVHRLDRDTSGLLVLARSEAVHARAAGRDARARSRASTSRWSRAAAGAARHDRRAARP